jgi:hypothetical protein
VAATASLAATTRIGPGFAMSSATRAASFPDIRVFMTPSSNREQQFRSFSSRSAWPAAVLFWPPHPKVREALLIPFVVQKGRIFPHFGANY